MTLETFSIARRFRGPMRSGNGGYVCGRIARHIEGPASVRLRIPPPLEVPLQVEAEDGAVRLMHGAQIVGEGRAAELDLAPPATLSLAEARQAAQGYRGFVRHSFPHCFVCGPQRGEHDGLRIFTGPVPGRDLVAAPWVVDATLAENGRIPGEFIWAALDCPGAFAVMPETDGIAIVLGELTARVTGSVRPGETCVAVGWPIRIEGRKRLAGSAVYSESGALLGVARAVWIEVPQSAFPADVPWRADA